MVQSGLPRGRMYECKNVSVDNGDDDLETVTAYDGRKLYELDIFESIEREKMTRAARNKEDVVRFSVGLDGYSVDEIDSIGSTIRGGEELIRSASILHGLSIVRNAFGKVIDEIDRMRILLINCDVREVRSKASSANTAIYEKLSSVKRRSVTIPLNVVGSVNKVSRTLFMDNSLIYQSCMEFSFSTRGDILSDRKAYFDGRRDTFASHVLGQYCLFKGQEYVLNNVINSEECRDLFDGLISFDDKNGEHKDDE